MRRRIIFIGVIIFIASALVVYCTVVARNERMRDPYGRLAISTKILADSNMLHAKKETFVEKLGMPDAKSTDDFLWEWNIGIEYISNHVAYVKRLSVRFDNDGKALIVQTRLQD